MRRDGVRQTQKVQDFATDHVWGKHRLTRTGPRDTETWLVFDLVASCISLGFLLSFERGTFPLHVIFS
jgi:hypothetical protein